MNLSTLSIKRPVTATVFSIVILLFGIIGFTYLGVREFPSVDQPVITVSTSYSGANSEVIESQITEPLEESINGISGIRSLTSTSSNGKSTIKVEFELSVDLEAAANDVRDKVSRAMRNLPTDVDPPIISKSDADAKTIFALSVQSNERNLLQLSDYGENVLKQQLQTIQGVSTINIWGDKEYAMRLELDPAKLAAYKLTPIDVQNALTAANIELPSGRIEGKNTELNIRTLGRLWTTKDFNNLIIKEVNGVSIKLKDIGHAELSALNQRTILRGNHGKPMIALAIQPQPGANYVDIVDAVYKKLARIKKDLPSDIQLGVAMDRTQDIRKGISEVEETVFIAFLLVIFIIFLFLRDWRTTLIPILAIPVSLIGAFFIMYVAGFSINLLTLLGIVLATGLVVDDAIVVLENIYAKIEEGMPPLQAANVGSKEIYFAIISTTITLVAVFMPIIFLSGFTGRLFREFGIVVAGAVLISAFVSLSLTPMLSSRLLRKDQKRSRFFNATEGFFVGMNNTYRNGLKKFMNKRWIAIVIMIVSILMIFGIGKNIHSELAPLEDKSRVSLFTTAPEGTSYEKMDKYMQKMLAICDTLPETQSLLSVTAPGFGSNTSVNTGFVILNLVPPSERKRSQQELANYMNKIVRKYNFSRTMVTQEPTIGSGGFGSLPVQYVVQAPTLEKLKAIIPKFMSKVANDPNFDAYNLDLKFDKPELQVEINREKARNLGVSVKDVAQTIQMLFGDQRFGYFIKNGKQYQIIGQAIKKNRTKPIDLQTVYVRSSSGKLVQLGSLVKLLYETSPPIIYHYNRYVSATFSAIPAKGQTIGQGIKEMDKIASQVLDDSYQTALAGQAKDFAESSSSLMFAFILALLLVYLALAAQFESFIDPLVIMFTVPLALAGALLTLWMFGQTLNIFSEIGIIVLVGIVTKNGILIVEFANQKQEQGMNKLQATIEASVQRFRPILMTSLATVLGALPIALALGDAATSRIPMGLVVIGGLLFSLILTLLVIPALYSYMASDKSKKDTLELE